MIIDHRPPLASHRLIGQGRGAALLRPTGEIDWWCPNRFDAEPLLWSLLDPQGGAAAWLEVELATWDGWPAGPTTHTVLRRGQDRVETWDGLLQVGSGTALIRLVRSLSAPCVLSHRLRCGGFAGGAAVHWTLGDDEATGADLRVLGRHRCGRHGELLTDVRVSERWSGLAVLSGCDHERVTIADLVELMEDADRDEDRFLERIQLPHDHSSRAVDALRVLRALTDPETGAPVAAPTTSLPEAPGGTRQFDYRYTWLRDSAYACATAALLGRVGASRDYLAFIADLIDRHDEGLTPLFTTAGERPPSETVVNDVSGWAGSTPVRVGNDATQQRQLDSITTILDAISVHIRCGGRASRQTWDLVEHLAELLVEAPFAPSSGIWEMRAPRRLVSEELARWIGLETALRLRAILRPWKRRPLWRVARDAARARVEASFDTERGMLPQSFDGPFVPDASALLACIHGFFPRRDPRARRLALSTVAALEQGSFLRRYPPIADEFEGTEATFLPASWWAVSALAAVGETDAARLRADDMCAQLPPLLSEEWDAEQRMCLGNTPLLWSHTEAARALYNLHTARIRKRFGIIGVAVYNVNRYARIRFLRRPGC